MLESASPLFWKWLEVYYALEWRNYILMPFLSLKLFVLTNWEELMAFALRHKISDHITDLLPTPLSGAARPSDTLSAAFFSKQFAAPQSVQTFQQGIHFNKRTGWITTQWPNILQNLSWRELSNSSKAVFTKGLFFQLPWKKHTKQMKKKQKTTTTTQ